VVIGKSYGANTSRATTPPPGGHHVTVNNKVNGGNGKVNGATTRDVALALLGCCWPISHLLSDFLRVRQYLSERRVALATSRSDKLLRSASI
jgi:hypothetical protein